ncbi:MAG: DUF3341 domain-containing protein [Bacteroidota bacterium]
MSHSSQFLVGVFDDDEVVLNAVRSVRASGVRVHEVYSPFPIHGIDDALGYKRTRLDIAAFMFGCCGFLGAGSLIGLTLGYDWPMNIGGKPFAPLPDFIPVTFEGTVLCTALGMVATFLLASGLFPGSTKTVFDARFSDDKFILAVELDKNHGHSAEQITKLLKSNGATEVNLKEVKD